MTAHHFSREGKYHHTQGVSNQDRIMVYENARYMIGVVADGVSQCLCADKGAELSCKAVLDFINRERNRVFLYSAANLSYLLIEHILLFLDKECMNTGNPIEEYASTFSAAFIDKQNGEIETVNLGDGAILLNRNHGIEVLSQPETVNGNPISTVSAGAHKKVRIDRTMLMHNETVMLCTDGFLNRYQGDILDMVRNKNYKSLNQCLSSSQIEDDYSYLAIEYS